MKITILHDGEAITHMASDFGSYATVCGVDGDDAAVGQVPSETNQDSKIDCTDCQLIWSSCRTFKAKDFAIEKLKAEFNR